ncbi:MAG TPA: cytochrome c oxidase assembly protein [Cellvibrio sp.]|nr:cytochrome c oxidase assembly protein [Cellvibrio sp.]
MTNQNVSHKPLLRKLMLVCLAMFLFGFALVPLYDVFCRLTGLNGKTANVAATPSTSIDNKRVIKVEFIANRDDSIPWTFSPEINSIELNPGAVKVINFNVRNLSAQATVGRAVPSVSPGAAARYFKKIECFCFTEQALDANGEKAMPVQFYIDPELPAEFSTITLSYRLYMSQGQTASR